MGRDVFILPENGPSLLHLSSRESRKGLSKVYAEYAQEMMASHRRAVDRRIQEYVLGEKSDSPRSGQESRVHQCEVPVQAEILCCERQEAGSEVRK